MSEQTISAAVGKATFQNLSHQLTVSVVEPPFTRKNAAGVGKRIGKSVYMAGTSPLHGAYDEETFSLPDGKVLLIVSKWASRGSPTRDGAIFLRLRTGGPLYSIRATLPMHQDARLGESMECLRCAGDILSAADLHALRIEPYATFSSTHMDPEEIDECFQITRVTEGATPKPAFATVTNAAGQTETVTVAARPTRRLNLTPRR